MAQRKQEELEIDLFRKSPRKVTGFPWSSLPLASGLSVGCAVFIQLSLERSV
jgi:hypothetical protein